jgi:hypothetical protein
MSVETRFQGNLDITSANINDFQRLEEIDGDLRVTGGAKGLTLWNLKKITKGLIINESNAVFPKLRSIGTDCVLKSSNTQLPVLTKVENLTITESAFCAEIPKLKHVDNLMVFAWGVDLSALETVKYSCKTDFDTNLPSLRIINGAPSGALGKRGSNGTMTRAEADISTLFGLSLTF